MPRPFVQGYSLPSGARRYRAWWYDAVGRKVGKVFPTKREADAFLRSKAEEEATGTLADTRAGRVTLRHVWNERRSREQFAPATLTLHDFFWKTLGPILGNRPIGDIRPAHIDAALAKFNGSATKDKARSALIATFNYAIAQRRIAVNPAKAPRKSRTRAARMAAKPSSAEDEQRYLTADQFRALLNETPDRYKALVELMARVGLRPGEAYALTVGQLDGRTLRIDRTVDGAWTKTGEPRTIVLPAVVAEMLADHISRYSNPTDGTALVFPNGNGKMLDRSSFRHVFQRASRRAGVNHGLSPNHMRHTAVAFAVSHGANVYDVQKMLGHAKASVTLDVYGFLWDGSSERLAEALDAAIRAAP